MAETKIKWNEGEGYITAAYDGSGNGSASISSDVNEGIDREQTINVSTTEGSNPKNEGVVVRQTGLREVFVASDGDFILADGGTLNVRKCADEITFIISYGGGSEVDTLTAKDGMTWTEYCNSSYNVYGNESYGYLESLGSDVMNSNNGEIVGLQSGEPVSPSDVIIANYEYIGH